jgi:acyl-CoA reductase-like NAD-dependent aldehyde dehydrogenase
MNGGNVLRASNWIDGERVSNGPVHDSIDPATYAVIGTYPDNGLDAAREAVAAATRAFRETPWARDHELRARVLEQLAAAFERNRDRLFGVLMLENGKVAAEAAFEIDMVPSKLRYAAAAALTESGRALTPRSGRISMVLRQPMGVAAVIAPWNSPVVLTIRSLAPALGAGCTTVIKLPGQVARTASVMADVMAEAVDLPAGVINLFFESGPEGSAYLVETPDVPVVSFTGSTRTGRAIGASGADEALRHGTGWQAPMIIFDDADVAAALPVLEKALTIFAGEFCMTGSRLLVQDGIYDRVRDGLAERLRAVRSVPVLTIQRFADEAQAVTLANDNEYGLSASLWMRDVDRSLRVAQAIDAGSVWINDWAQVFDSTEEGGFKQSGLCRLNGLASFDDFVEYKHIALNPGLLQGRERK